MINIDQIINLADQYAKHKWVLRRILLCEGSFDGVSDEVRAQFPDVDVSLHEINAIWFSRKNKDSETWEIRRLGSPPYALVEVIDDVLSAEERENRLAFLEHEMADESQRPTNFGSENPNGNL